MVRVPPGISPWASTCPSSIAKETEASWCWWSEEEEENDGEKEGREGREEDDVVRFIAKVDDDDDCGPKPNPDPVVVVAVVVDVDERRGTDSVVDVCGLIEWVGE